MIYAAELLFDLETESRILDIWSELRNRGLSSSMFDVGAKPHVTIAVWESVDDLPSLQKAIADFAGSTPPLPMQLTSVASFITSPGVVFLAPTPTREIIDFHRDFHDFLGDFPATSYLPIHWEPHCTVAIDLAPERVAPAMEVCKAGGEWIKGSFTRITLISHPPTTHLAEFRLAGMEPS